MPLPRSAPVLAGAMLTASVGTSAANIALPVLVEVFDAPAGSVQWVVIAYLLGMTAASLLAGTIGDRLGRRRVLVAGVALFTLAAAVSALAPTLVILTLARGLQGVGAAVMTTLPLALARDLTEEGRTGRVMGLLGTTSAIGTALGPALGGVLLSWGGWSAPFWAMVALGAVTLSMAGLVPAATPRPSRARRFDTLGAVFLTAAVSAFALALSAPSPEWPVLPLLLGAAVLVAAFIGVERHASDPVLPLPVLRTRPIAIGAGTNLLVAAVMIATLVIGPYALHDGLGLEAAAVGLVMAVGPATSAVSGVLAGRVVDRTSPATMTTTGLTLMTAGAALLAFLPPWWGVPGYLAALIVLTPGYQLFLAANNTLMLTSAQPDQRGTVSGVLGLSRNLGLVTGSAAMGGLYAVLVGPETPGTDALSAARIVFLLAALLAGLATLASTLRSPAPVPS